MTEHPEGANSGTGPSFSVLDTGTTIDDAGTRWPTAVIDARSSPAVTDLARVHAVEGIGDISTDAVLVPTDPTAEGTRGVDHLLVLAIVVTLPVRCSFAIVFSLPRQRDVVDDALDAGRLVIATTEPERAADDRPLWLAIDLDPTLLADVLPT